MVTKSKAKPTREVHDATAYVAASTDSLVSEPLPVDKGSVIAGGKLHAIPSSEIARFYVELTKNDDSHAKSEFLILPNDALNNISSIGHYYKKANVFTNAQGKNVATLQWHLDQLNHERKAFMVGLIDTLVHVECGIAQLKQTDDKVATKYGHATNGRHNGEFVGIARKYFDTFIESGDIDPTTGLVATTKRENSPLKLNDKTQRFVDSFKFDESKFTVTLQIPEADPDAEVSQRSLKLTCEVHNKFVISVPVATQNAKNDDKSPVRYKWSCDVITSKVDARVERTCNKVLIAKV